MMRCMALAVALLAWPAAMSAYAQAPETRTALVARAQAAVVEIRVEPAPRPAPPKRVLRLSEGQCADSGGTWLGDRRCEVADTLFPLPPTPRRDTGQMGSGFVVDAARGLILTANHIVPSERAPTVRLADGRELAATIAGRDEATGIAVLRVEAGGMTALPLATRPPVVGEASLLVGRLLPYDSTVATSGMVGGMLSLDDQGNNLPWLSDIWLIDNLLPGGGLGGGPVLGSGGEVIGIATAIFGREGYGQSAATIMVALNGMQPVIEALAATGSVARSHIGISLDCDKGACQVAVIIPDGSAEAAGLRVGDRIVSIDGRSFTKAGQITRYIAGRPVGSAIALAIERGGVAQLVNVVTGSISASTAPVED